MDLVRLDRNVMTAARADPFAIDWEDFRHVSGQRALRELEQESASPLRDALASWIAWLTVARVSQPAERALAEARRSTRVVVRVRADVQMNEPEIVSGLLGAQTRGEADAHFAAWPEVGPTLRPLIGRVRETRAEAFRRLGIEDVGARFVGIPSRELIEAAERFLVVTRDLADACVPREEPWPLALDVRLARRATEGWPARLAWRTVTDLVAGLGPYASLPEPPRALGGASFARALAMLGLAFRRTCGPESTPFALREPPLFAEGHRTAWVLATSTQEPAFHTRVLGLGAGRAKDQARTMRVALFLHARLIALRVALAKPGADAPALAELAFGRFPTQLATAWPRFRDEDFAALVGLAGALELHDALREREGDDWFKNPRALATLRDLSLVPFTTKGLDLRPLAKRFEETLA